MPRNAELPPLYAMYLQATRNLPGATHTNRKQWIVFPPLTSAHAAALGPTAREALPTDARTMLHFWREQITLENRPKWRWGMYEPAALERSLPDQLAALREQFDHLPAESRWQVAPVITAQVTPAELVALLREPKTPYAVLRRFAAVAKARYNIAI